MTRGEAMALGCAAWLTAVTFAGLVHIDQANAARSKAAVTDRKIVHYENSVEIANQRAQLANQRTLLQRQSLPFVEPVLPPPPSPPKS